MLKKQISSCGDQSHSHDNIYFSKDIVKNISREMVRIIMQICL